MYYYKIIIAKVFIFCFISCQKPWPDNKTLRNELEAISSSSKQTFIKLIGNYAYDNMFNCAIESIKISYKNYSEYEKALNENPNELSNLLIPCILNNTGENIDILWNSYEQNEEYKEIRNRVSEKHLNLFKKHVITGFYDSFGNMSNLLKQLLNDPVQVDLKIRQAIYDGGEYLNQLVEKENNQLLKFETLLKESSSNFGIVTFQNNNYKKITMCIGYYHQGNRWSGWATKGWWNLEPGEKINIHIPSNDGSLNRYIYYYSYFDGGEYSGNQSFIVSKKAFQIPNADKINADDFSDFYVLSKFKKNDLGDSLVNHYTFTFR